MKVSSRALATKSAIIAWLIAGGVSAAEIITVDDIKQKTIVEKQLVRVADNAIFLLDASTSMEEKYGDTGMSAHQVVVNEFKKRNAYFPNLGHNFGIYLYTPWKVVYPMQPYDREKMAAALESIPEEPVGPTWLNDGLKKAGEVLETLSGKTILFVFTDGTHTSIDDRAEPSDQATRPIDIAADLVSNHDVCIYAVSSATEDINERIIENLASLNSCSRLIRFADFVNRPAYNSGALFAVKAQEKVVTVTDQKIVGLKVDDLTFEFAGSDLRRDEVAKLEAVVDFLKTTPNAWVTLEGYTDAIGSDEVNNRLSRQRAETVAAFLTRAGVSRDRIVAFWYGARNPVASNETNEGRAKNRRVEMAVGL